MGILVLNSGSSSLKFRLYTEDADAGLRVRLEGAISGFGARAEWSLRADGRGARGRADIAGQRAAAVWLLRRLAQERTPPVTAIGHRVVHGGPSPAPELLTEENIARLDRLSALAPLHNPPALEVIRACREALGDTVPMAAVFDTAFHATLPERARRYALPEDWVNAYGIRRYGFHGLAHRSMYERYLRLRGDRPAPARVVAFQLGHGCSAAAIAGGESIETSMGYTPLEGLVMSTRSGDVDPGAIVRLAAAGIGAGELERRLNRDAGLLALSGASGDMRELLALEARGHEGARRAVEAFCHRARKYLGAYLAVLGGAEAVLFGGGIGENAPAIRARVCAGMQWCGLRLDARANRSAIGAEALLSTPDSAIAVYSIGVDEEILIAQDVRRLLGSGGR